jgi:exosortase
MSQAATANASLPRDWGDLIPPAAWLRMLCVAVLLVAAYWTPVRHHMVGRWLSDGNWSHGFLVPVFSLYFLYTKKEELLRSRPEANWLGAVVLLFSLLANFYFAWSRGLAYPQDLTILGSIFGVTLLLGGWRVVKIAWFPILFLVFAIPLPANHYVALTMPLRELASTVASAILPLLAPGLHTETQRVIIDYIWPSRLDAAGNIVRGSLNIEEACSGMRLMMSFVALGVAMAYLAPRPVWQRLVMVASCVPIAVLCNTIRVVITGLLQVHGYSDQARGTPHALLGIGTLLIAFGLYSALGWVLSNLFVDDTSDKEDEAQLPTRA